VASSATSISGTSAQSLQWKIIHPLGQLLQHHQHHQPHPLGQIHQIRVYMTILSTIEVAEPEAVVERYVTISSIII
jgi:hypothetical protein